MAEQTPLQHENTIFIGRREVMFQALTDYNAADHSGQDDKQKIGALLAAVDKAAAGNGRLSADDKTKVAGEWAGLIKSKAGAKEDGSFATPDNILAFAGSDAIKNLVKQDLPAISQDSVNKLPVNLATVDVAKMSGLEKLTIGMSLGEDASRMSQIADMNARFEDAAKATRDVGGKKIPALVNYAGGETLTALLNAQNTGAKQPEQKKEAAQTSPGAAAPDDQAPAPAAPAAGGMFGGLFGGMMQSLMENPIVALIMGFIAMLTGNNMRPSANAPQPAAAQPPEPETDKGAAKTLNKEIDTIQAIADQARRTGVLAASVMGNIGPSMMEAGYSGKTVNPQSASTGDAPGPKAAR